MEWAIVVALFCVIVYLVNNYFFNYWKRRNFPQVDPTFLVGNCGKLFKFKTCFTEFLCGFYEKYKHEKVIGIYFSYQPALIVNDPVIAQQILIKDFNSFHDRATAVNEEVDPLTGNLFFVKGKKWRELRVKCSPLFTSGKLKVMLPLMRECGSVLQNYISKNIEDGSDVIDFKDLSSRFTINVISSVGFGIEIDCINERDHIFRQRGIEIFTGSFKRAVINFIFVFWPKLMEKFKIRFSSKDLEDFFASLSKQTVEYREKNNIKRNDFMDLMIQLKNYGYVTADKEQNDDKINDSENENLPKLTKLTMKEIMAQSFVFFAAGM